MITKEIEVTITKTGREAKKLILVSLKFHFWYSLKFNFGFWTLKSEKSGLCCECTRSKILNNYSDCKFLEDKISRTESITKNWLYGRIIWAM